MALRSLAHAAECLTDRREQEEVLQIFNKINKETGWRIAFVYKELKEKWGWTDGPSPPAPPNAPHTSRSLVFQSQLMGHGHGHSGSVGSFSSQGGQYPTQQGMQSAYGGQSNSGSVSAPPPPPTAAAPPRQKPPSGIVNPMYSTADFSMPQHPYQNVYVAPNLAAHTHHSTGLYY